MATSRSDPTTGHRTHRYLRLSLSLIVVAILVGVAIESLELGTVLPSISHYYYTPVQGVFVGALIAASVALAALSGRGLETTLLDIAAVFAPLIALVPTGVYGRSLQSELGLSCPPRTMCIPDPYADAVRIGVGTYLVVLLVVLVMAVALRVRGRVRGSGVFVVGAIAAVTAIVIAALTFLPPWSDGFPTPAALPLGIHYPVTIAFFAAFATVPIINAFRRTTDEESKPKLWQKVVYVTVAVVLVADLVLLVFFSESFGTVPIVFIGEAGALVLFAIFWFVQTFQRWDEKDQAFVLPTPPLAWREVG